MELSLHGSQVNLRCLFQCSGSVIRQKCFFFFCGQTLRNVERLTLGKQEPEANLSSDFLLFDEGPVDVSKSHLNFLSKAFKSFF